MSFDIPGQRLKSASMIPPPEPPPSLMTRSEGTEVAQANAAVERKMQQVRERTGNPLNEKWPGNVSAENRQLISEAATAIRNADRKKKQGGY